MVRTNEEIFFLDKSLYEPLIFSDENIQQIINFFFNTRGSQFDCYCIDCEKDSTFKYYSSTSSNIENSYPLESKRRYVNSSIPFQMTYSCQRHEEHKYSFSFRIMNNEIIKVGQYPSVADIASESIKKYKKILANDHRDFSKAIGLHSHGIGAGSFVYLRRIFENLIEKEHIESTKDDNWDEAKYIKSKMDEKIKLLEDKLPKVLVENRKVYGILSKGIHELSEDDCLDLFPDVQLAIELILDEKIYQQDRLSKLQTLKGFISKTTEKLKS